MSRSLIELYEEQGGEDPGNYPFGLLPTRQETVESLKSGRTIDVVILGNDLPCALTAQLLALNGVRVLLLTQGPLTPLGAASILDILEASQMPLFKALHHLPSLLKSNTWLERYAPHRMVPITNDNLFHARSLGSKFLARTGIPTVLDDGAMVAEGLLAARRDGAVVLPYSEPLYLETVGSSGIRILGLRDRLSGDTFEVRSGGVVVGHGIPVPGSRLRVGSEGNNLVSGAAIAQCGVVLETPKNFEVSPDLGGAGLQKCTLKNGIETIVLRRPSGGVLLTLALSNVERELEEITETINRTVGAVVGSVIIPKASFASGAELILGKGVMRIPSSSPLIACAIANNLAYLYARSAGRILNDLVTAEKLTNPGALRTLRSGASSPVDSFKKEAALAKVTGEFIDQAIARWGDRVRYIGDFKDGFSVISKGVLRGELGIAVLADQIFHVDDLPHSLLRCRAENPQDREKIQQEIGALQEEASLHTGGGARKTV